MYQWLPYYNIFEGISFDIILKKILFEIFKEIHNITKSYNITKSDNITKSNNITKSYNITKLQFKEIINFNEEIINFDLDKKINYLKIIQNKLIKTDIYQFIVVLFLILFYL